jgi:hypothetical protein
MASISKVKICNMALSSVGKGTIEAIDEDSAEANQCDLWYDHARQEALEAYDWSFARKRDTLSEHSDDPPDQWTYRYTYPADCVALRRLWNPSGEEDDAVPYEIETDDENEVKTVLTDQEDAVAVYTFDCETTTLFSKHFVKTLAANLAHYIAYALTGKRGIQDSMLSRYNGYIRSASGQNANEKVDAPPREAEWIRGR